MKVAIHQVNYMPWLGFFNKLKQANKLVMYDIADYTKNDVQNRNKIRTKEGWIYLTVPIEKKYYRRPFYEVLLSENNKWQNKHWKAIKLNYSKADYFDSYKDFFEKLYKKKFMTLLELNECITIYLIKEFGINLDIIKTTDLEFLTSSALMRLPRWYSTVSPPESNLRNPNFIIGSSSSTLSFCVMKSISSYLSAIDFGIVSITSTSFRVSGFS